MTTGKRALIVDDSRSARVILSRMLEQHGLTVDTAESAEQALEYLQRTRPDVIFMDHLMPGMDGFQAVQAIKADPLTATIPLMMYTSQEGELYVSQARALGAVGVYGVVSYSVERRRTEYGIRMALGANPGTLLRVVMGHGMLPVLVGVLIGSGLALLGLTMVFGHTGRASSCARW